MSQRDVTPPKMPFSLKPGMIILVLAAVVVLVLVLSSFFVVDQTEESVVLLLGKYNRTAGPGLHWKAPFGIEKNYNVQTQIIHDMSFGFRTERAGVNTVYSNVDYPEESVMLTGDLNIVDVEWTIQYRITDARAWLFNVDNRDKTIRDISQSVVNQLVGDRGILDVIGSERSNIEYQGQQEMNKLFDSYGLGITITTVKLRNIVPPAGQVKDAFEDVNKAVQDMNRYINEGKETYNQEIPKARGDAERLVQQAQGYAIERVNNATGDVSRFDAVLEQYNLDPQTTRTRLYYEMVEDVFSGDHGENLIDRNLNNYIPLLNLPSNSSAQGSLRTDNSSAGGATKSSTTQGGTN